MCMYVLYFRKLNSGVRPRIVIPIICSTRSLLRAILIREDTLIKLFIEICISYRSLKLMQRICPCRAFKLSSAAAGFLYRYRGTYMEIPFAPIFIFLVGAYCNILVMWQQTRDDNRKFRKCTSGRGEKPRLGMSKFSSRFWWHTNRAIDLHP